MEAGRLRLRPLRLADEDVVRAAHEVMREDAFGFAIGLTDDGDWADFVAMHDRYRHGRRLPAGLVPATFLLAEVDGTIVGRTSIRHELNDFLREEGGHIGYGVLPVHRRRGYATEILRQSLVVARSLGVTRVLVTCDNANEASARVIERNGGILENIVTPAGGTAPTRRYWID